MESKRIGLAVSVFRNTELVAAEDYVQIWTDNGPHMFQVQPRNMQSPATLFQVHLIPLGLAQVDVPGLENMPMDGWTFWTVRLRVNADYLDSGRPMMLYAADAFDPAGIVRFTDPQPHYEGQRTAQGRLVQPGTDVWTLSFRTVMAWV